MDKLSSRLHTEDNSRDVRYICFLSWPRLELIAALIGSHCVMVMKLQYHMEGNSSIDDVGVVNPNKCRFHTEIPYSNTCKYRYSITIKM